MRLTDNWRRCYTRQLFVQRVSQRSVALQLYEQGCYTVQWDFLQQKVSVLISDWLPAVIDKSTDARKLTSASRNKNTRSHFLNFYNGFRYLIQIFLTLRITSLNGKMFQTRNLLGTFENEFWLFIQSVNLFTSHSSVDSVNHLSFLNPIRCRESY